jgi:hypothetical protein
VSRNLTLILKSDRPVRWTLRSHGITGNLLVAAGQHNSSPNQMSFM